MTKSDDPLHLPPPAQRHKMPDIPDTAGTALDLTGLLIQRPLLTRILELTLAECRRTGTYDALILLDLDNVKAINQGFGRPAGDALLRDIARRLRDVTGSRATVAHLGSDEFAIVCHTGSSSDTTRFEAQQLAAHIVHALGAPHSINGQILHATGSIGVALLGPDTVSVDELFRQADMAMYEAKAAGRNNYRHFDLAVRAQEARGVALDRAMRHALRDQQFVLYYQPVFDEHRRMTGAEALIRWAHPERGLIGPHEFIAHAEKSHLIVEIGDWVLRAACLQLAAWQRDSAASTLTIAVNVSERQIRQPDFVARILDILAETSASSLLLRLELTESMLVGDVDDIVGKMNELQSHEIGFALDDFGTGFSSLCYLERLPVTHIKIDRSFVNNMLATSRAAKIVEALIALAHTLELEVVAEGVETEEQLAALVSFGVHSFQGYLLARPVPVSELQRWLA